MVETNPRKPVPVVKLAHPEWSKNASIYHLNTRQFTEEGTFRAAEAHLPRLKNLGVDILWLLPVHEIGWRNRKGKLGSPYAVKDYYSVNPEFGTLADLKHFVDAAHALELRVILDWVGSHTSWDNGLVEQHPDWYVRDWKGDFRPTPWWEWRDIIDLDYEQEGVRRYMTEALKYWVRVADVDGFRCDVAGFAPPAFWNNVRRELERIKPVFLLAEWENSRMHVEAFDMTYAWSWHDAVRQIALGKVDLRRLNEYYEWNERVFPADAMRMLFVSSHDMNAWEGTEFEQFGDALEAVIVLSVVSEGMPMIYSGQEAGNQRRLAFFDRDPIEWREHPIGALYQKLLALKKENTALWNGKWGARMVRVPNSAPAQVFSFVRQNERDKVFAVLNFSPEAQTVTFSGDLYPGPYCDAFTGESLAVDPGWQAALPPWGYQVLVKPLA